MAYNELLAHRIRQALLLLPEEVHLSITEKKMFGGLSFLFHGKMTVGIIKEELIVRVIAEKMDAVLERDGVRPMDFTNKPLKEFVYVIPEVVHRESELNFWIALGIEHAKSKL